MLKGKKKESLADQIADILTPAPQSLDPEDAGFDGTQAKFVDEELDGGNDDDEEEILSKFRRENVDLLADVDQRYAGTKGSRKRFREDSDSEGFDDDHNISEGDNKSEESSLDDEEEDGEEQSDESIEEEEENDDNFQHIQKDTGPNPLKKGQSVRNQINIWENLLEMRIQLQKCLIASNKLPETAIFKELNQNSDFSSKITDSKSSLSKLLDKMLLLQNLLQKQYPETKNLTKQTEALNEDDEEIPSDTEDEQEVQKEEAPTNKKRKFQDFEIELNKHHETYSKYRNSVIKKWYDKTRLAVAKNNVASHSVLEQIDHLLSDRPKLRRRTQLRRSNYKIIGEQSDEEEEQQNEKYNSNVFDDDDFYHQLLRELIEVRSADVTDPIQLGRQWIQLQSMRSKMKRKIDTRATKGRKIRYVVHSKLVNFMAPIDTNTWTDEAKNELYSSLFGKNAV